MGGNVSGSAAPSGVDTGSAAPSGGKGPVGSIQPYQGGQQQIQGQPYQNGSSPFGLFGLGANQPQTQQAMGLPVQDMLQTQGQNQAMQQNPFAQVPAEGLNKMNGLMGGFGGQLIPEGDTFQNGQAAAMAAQNAFGQQHDFMEHLRNGGKGYGKGGDGAMPNPYQPQTMNTLTGSYSEPFNPASDEGMVGPGYQSQTASQAVQPMPEQLGISALAPAATPAPIAPAPTQAATQTAAPVASPAQQLPDQSQGLSYRGMTMKKGGRVK